MSLTINEQPEVRKCINFRLGLRQLEKTECVNKIIRRSLPNRLTLRSNFHSGANSAVHAANQGTGESIMALC